jgi:OmpA-like transmembrane domain
MKRTILYFALLFFVSIGLINAQKYGLGNTDPSVFTKFRIPETDLSKIWFNTNLFLNTDKMDYSLSQSPGRSSSYHSTFNYSLTPNYYLLRESEDNYLLLNTSLSGTYNKSYAEDHYNNSQKTSSRTRDYGTDLSLIFTDNKYINQSDLFYSLGSNIRVDMVDEQNNSTNGILISDIYYGNKQQNYSFAIGMGIGKQRNVTPIVSTIRFQERLKQLNMLNGDLSDKTIEDLAQQFYKQTYYSSIHERPDKYFWQDIEKTLLQDGVTLKDLNMYADNYLRESVNEVRFLRSEALMAGLNLRAQYQNRYSSNTVSGSNINEQLLTLGEVYFIYSHQLNLNSQLNIGMTINGGPNITKHPDERQQYLFAGNAGYDYELTDRLVASLNNAFNVQFMNYDKEEKFLSNILGFTLRYFIEDNLSLNANYQWSYRVNKYLYNDNYTYNTHTINLGFTYYFEKGFQIDTNNEQPVAVELHIVPHNYAYSTKN